MGERRDWHLGGGSMGVMEKEGEDRWEGRGKRDRGLGGAGGRLAQAELVQERGTRPSSPCSTSEVPVRHVPV